MEHKIIEALKTVFDPEIPVDIYELGLIYDVRIHEKVDNIQQVDILMTLTSPNCPVAESLPLEVKEAVLSVDGVDNVNLELTFDPPFTADMMSEVAKLELGLM